MEQRSGYIDVGRERLHYLQWGSGRRLLLAFHGYGNEAGLFAPFAPYLHAHYTILSFNLPHHGLSKWGKNVLLTTTALGDVVRTVMVTHKVAKVSLMGYSMGGRVCLAITEYMPASVAEVVLLASDGLTVNWYYYFFTRTYMGKKLFGHLLNRTERYLGLLGWLKNRKLIDGSRHKFVTQYLQHEERRRFLHQVWPGMSDLIPRPVKLKKAIQQYGITVNIFMGAYDKVMPPGLAHKFKSGQDTVHVHVLDRGHRLMDSETVQEIAGVLL